jgi:hypothetical protein
VIRRCEKKRILCDHMMMYILFAPNALSASSLPRRRSPLWRHVSDRANARLHRRVSRVGLLSAPLANNRNQRNTDFVTIVDMRNARSVATTAQSSTTWSSAVHASRITKLNQVATLIALKAKLCQRLEIMHNRGGPSSANSNATRPSLLRNNAPHWLESADLASVVRRSPS